MELLSGLVFVAVPYILYPESYAISAVWILILLIFILISVIDFRHFIIPDELVWLLLFLGAAFIFLQTQTPNLDFLTNLFFAITRCFLAGRKIFGLIIYSRL